MASSSEESSEFTGIRKEIEYPDMTELRYALRGKDVDMMWYCLRCNKLSPTDAVGVQNRKDNGGADKMGTESCVMNISPTYHTIYFRVPYHVCQLVCVFGHDGDHMMR